MSLPPASLGRWQTAKAIAWRDLLEFVRDRRTLFVTLLMPMAMYPVLALSSLLGVRTAIEDADAGLRTSRLTLAVSGVDAPAFVGRVRGLPEAVTDLPDWPEHLEIEAVRSEDARRLHEQGTLDAWIDVPPGTAAGLDATGTVALDVRLPAREPPGSRVRAHVAAVLRGLAEDTRRRRVAAVGLPRSLLEPLVFTFVGGAADARRLAPLRSVVPIAAGAVLVLLALLMATGAFYPAIDAIAGEKERGTIETLLMAPCSPAELVLGKFLAVLGVTLATLAANVISIGLTLTVLLRFLPSGGGLGLSPGTLAVTLLIALPAFIGLAAVAAAMSLAVTAASKSVKEAQNTLTPVILLVSGLAGAALLPGVDERPWLLAVPFTGQVAVTRSVLITADQAAGAGPAAKVDTTASAAPVASLLITLASSAIITWLLLRATAKVVTDEEILFRGPDAATAGFSRPAPRSRPTAWQGFGAALAGFALLWYVQGLAPADLPRAILFQQAVAVLVPLASLAWWQRVDARATFSLRWPTAAVTSTALATIAAAAAGGGLFILGAAALLSLRGGGLSPEAEALSLRLFTFMRETPWWQAGALIALVPAVAEELFFRGWVLAAFAGDPPRRGRQVGANVSQAAVFALFHLLPERMPQTFVLGLLLGWMTLRSGSILPAVAGHLAHNAMPLVLLALAGDAVLDPQASALGAARLPAGIVVAGGAAFLTGIAVFIGAARRIVNDREPS